jgi:hypothetical protein
MAGFRLPLCHPQLKKMDRDFECGHPWHTTGVFDDVIPRGISNMKPLLILLLSACACSAAIVVDETQIWDTDGTQFRWIWQENYGYEPIDLQGRIVSGLTDGAIVWLVDDGSGGSGPCCQPGPPSPPPTPPTPPVTVTPEPGSLWIMGAGLLSLAGLYWKGVFVGQTGDRQRISGKGSGNPCQSPVCSGTVMVTSCS